MSPFLRFFLFSMFLGVTPLFAQNAQELISAIRRKQATLKTISYTLHRTDTLVTGTTRQLSGTVQLLIERSDSLFGFRFHAREDKATSEVVYNGYVAYETNDTDKTYTLLTSPEQIRNLRYHSGGRLLVPDLVNIDTTKATRFTLTKDQHSYYLVMHYADLTEYDVSNRFKTIQIDRETLVPMAVREHQETLGKVQDLFYSITKLAINNPSFSYSFTEPAFHGAYRQKVVTLPSSRSNRALIDKPAPSFSLVSLDSTSISSSALPGKITLLDFWEVWPLSGIDAKSR